MDFDKNVRKCKVCKQDIFCYEHSVPICDNCFANRRKEYPKEI